MTEWKCVWGGGDKYYSDSGSRGMKKRKKMKLKLWGTVKTESGYRWDSMKTEKICKASHKHTYIPRHKQSNDRN